MNVRINKYMLTQTSWDSGSLTPLAAVLHLFKEPGSYQGILYRDQSQVGLFDLLIDENFPNGQVDIDLEAVQQGSFNAGRNRNVFKASPQHPVLFYVPRGRGGYSVAVFKANSKRRSAIFNSLRLENGDVFMVTPNRSGIYVVSNQDKAKGEISVQKRGVPAVPTEPVIIDVEYGTFKPANEKAQFMQPIFFHIKTPSQIKVQLKSETQPSVSKPKRPGHGDKKSKR